MITFDNNIAENTNSLNGLDEWYNGTFNFKNNNRMKTNSVFDSAGLDDETSKKLVYDKFINSENENSSIFEINENQVNQNIIDFNDHGFIFFTKTPIKKRDSEFEIKELEKERHDLSFIPAKLEMEYDEFIILNDKNLTNIKINKNQFNQNRIDFLDKRITPLFISLIKNEYFEFGKKSESVKLVEEQIKSNSVATQYWFNKLFIKSFACNEIILIGLLRVIESLEEKSLGATGKTIAIAALSHKNNEIKELGVRIFENWCSIESYEILKSIKVETKWLQEYISQVIEDIKIQLCL